MRQRSRLRLLAILLGLSMVAAACGDDDDTEAGEDTDTTEADEGGESLAPELGDAPLSARARRTRS